MPFPKAWGFSPRSQREWHMKYSESNIRLWTLNPFIWGMIEKPALAQDGICSFLPGAWTEFCTFLPSFSSHLPQVIASQCCLVTEDWGLCGEVVRGAEWDWKVRIHHMGKPGQAYPLAPLSPHPGPVSSLCGYRVCMPHLPANKGLTTWHWSPTSPSQIFGFCGLISQVLIRRSWAHNMS